MPIRPPLPDELPVLQELELAAGEAFRAIGMPEIADDGTFPLATLEGYRRAGRIWVHDVDGSLDAYLMMDVVDELYHIEQVSVHPRSAGHGLGRDLIGHLSATAADQNVPALTLTTFTDVPWNAPYYRRLGFRPCCEPGPQLRALRDREAEHGLDRWPRICMIRSV